MPFDSFMTSALVSEISSRLVGLKVDKVCQPERDEVDLLFHFSGRNRLLINCTASTPYMALSSESRENPPVPPMMCMLLRKHLLRAKITRIEQIGFDRIVKITFDSGDEMGFYKTKYLYCEMMGRGSNLIFADENGIILAAFRQNDITTKFDRLVMVGSPYQPMPIDRINPILCDKDHFLKLLGEANSDTKADLFLQKHFLGFGKLTAREVVFRACGNSEEILQKISPKAFWEAFSFACDRVRNDDFSPCLVYESKAAFESGESPIDFSFMEITQFGSEFFISSCQSVSEAIETYYQKRNLLERHRQHYNDIAQILKNCRKRLEKKIALQREQLSDSMDSEEMRLFGDLVMQEMYRIKRGDQSVDAFDYASDPPKAYTIPLDPMLTPSQNAQSYYREYAKKKTSQQKMLEQIRIAEEELLYVDSVTASLLTATSSAELEQIRQELSHWNYGRRLVSSLKKPKNRKEKPKPREAKSPNGFLIFLGMNNLQNDTVSTSLSAKEDLWFHIKNYHGSHVLLKAEPNRDFKEEDIEFAASLAAYYSELKGEAKVEVDYTSARFIKKPNGSKPGFITYKNHNTVFVTPKPMN